MIGIENEHLLTDVFGYFPSFHDAEVLSINLDREDARLEVLVNVFEMTKDVDENNRYVLRKHSLVKFKFSRILNLELSDFNQQNVLARVKIKKLSDRASDKVKFHALFQGISGVTVEFHCEAACIESVEPFSPVNKNE